MPRFKLTLEYHGGPFVGWQIQDNGPSIQGALIAALRALGELRGVGEPAGQVVGAGRTDAGVHALGQVAHAELARNWDPFRLSEALNHHLKPDPISVLAAERAADDFHARFDAVARAYLYRIAPRRAPLAVERGLLWRARGPLDVAAMNRAAAYLVGRHDFTTFRAAQCQARSPIKTLDVLRISQAERGEVRIEAQAPSFLHNQVRSLVGALERVGAGKWPAERVADALAARDRSACAPVAPPDGLYLTRVDYPDPADPPAARAARSD